MRLTWSSIVAIAALAVLVSVTSVIPAAAIGLTESAPGTDGAGEAVTLGVGATELPRDEEEDAPPTSTVVVEPTEPASTATAPPTETATATVTVPATEPATVAATATQTATAPSTSDATATPADIVSIVTVRVTSSDPDEANVLPLGSMLVVSSAGSSVYEVALESSGGEPITLPLGPASLTSAGEPFEFPLGDYTFTLDAGDEFDVYSEVVTIDVSPTQVVNIELKVDIIGELVDALISVRPVDAQRP